MVHIHHGVGRFVKMLKMPVDGVEKDYIQIAYAGGDTLYVPATQLDQVSKYIGSGGSGEESAPARLNKLGGTDWSKQKSKARKAGWESEKGNLWDVLPGMSIGGSEFYNDEKLLPDADGRRWSECDIDYEGGYRNAKRIVFSNDGLVFYTGDHYKTFEQLY